MSNQQSDNSIERQSGDPQADAAVEQRVRARSGDSKRPIVSAILGLLKALFVIGLLAGGAYAAYWFNATEGTSEKSDEPQEEASRLVETVVAKRKDQPVRLRALGEVMASKESVIRPRVSGMIVEQSGSFVPGGFFQAGEFMVQIDRADYEQALAQRTSALAQAEAALQIELGDQAVAEEELRLLEVDVPAINRDLILRIPQVNQAKAEVQSAEVAIQRAELDLQRTRITAPFDGQIVARSATEGNNVSAGDALATLVGSHEYWIELTVPVSSLRWIEVPRGPESEGSRARVLDRLAWGRGASREGEVAQLVGRLEQGSRQARVIVRVPDPLAREPENEGAPALLLGALVEVEVVGRTIESAFAIDRDLIRENDVVWVMGDDDRLETKPVTIAYRGRELVYITEGLDDGDRVVVTNLQTPVTGMLLRDANEEADASDE